ncbi:SH2 domain-containing protein 2A [Taeniopygia guttata]|uniref:SH2 domain-containing protein 2A n=1 Tax=Taeniopygia guttata TaxID=59729 RepID=UPI003BB93CB3
MDEDQPLFVTFKGEDGTGRANPAPKTTPRQPPRAQQAWGQHRRVPPGFWSPPAAQAQAGREALRAHTRLWFEQTQAQRLGDHGELPSWFHGFISRREAEELLQDQPLGCFLVRFSESTVGFVLSYRGRDRCRHFVLDHLPDGRYAILGERSAHAALAELLQHHATAPLTPYREFLTVALPCARQEKPPGWAQPPVGSDAARSPPSQAPAELPGHRSASLRSAREAPGAPPPSLPVKSGSRGAARGVLSPSGSTAAAPEAPYAQVHKESAHPEPHEAKYQQLMCFHIYAEPREEMAPSTPSRWKPQEPIPEGPIPKGPIPEGPIPKGPIPKGPIPEGPIPKGPIPEGLIPEGPIPEGPTPEGPIPKGPIPEGPIPEGPISKGHIPKGPIPEGPTPEGPIPEGPIPKGPIPKGPIPEGPTPEGPIPFYAMTRGWSPRADPEENIYSEVGLARQDAPPRLPTAPQNAFSTLPPKARPHRRLFRSVSSQDCRRRQPAAAHDRERRDTGTQVAASPELELDDPVFRSSRRDPAENVYEQLPGDCP